MNVSKKSLAIWVVVAILGLTLFTAFLGHNYGGTQAGDNIVFDALEVGEETVIVKDCADGRAIVDIQQLGYNDYAVIEVERNGETLRQPVYSTEKKLPDGGVATLNPIEVRGDRVTVTVVDGSVMSKYSPVNVYPATKQTVAVDCKM